MKSLPTIRVGSHLKLRWWWIAFAMWDTFCAGVFLADGLWYLSLLMLFLAVFMLTPTENYDE